MLKLIYGYPGSGKSTRMYEYLREDIKKNKNVIFIVPEQSLVVTERRIADTIPAGDSLSVEVLSFRRLANRVFREMGGLCYNYLGKGADMLLMWRSLGACAPFLSHFGRTDPCDIGTVSALLDARKMTLRGGITTKMMEEMALLARDEDEKLGRKLSDMSLVFAAYSSMLGERFDDPEEDLSRLCALEGAGEFFHGKSVYIDDFNSLTPLEYSVLELIVKSAEAVYVSVNYREGEERDIFRKTQKYARTLRRIADKYGIELMRESTDGEFGTAETQKIKKELFSPEKCEKLNLTNENVNIIKCTDRSSEIETVFEDILKYVKNEGGRYADCVIAAGNIGDYLGYIRGCSEKYNVPCFTSGRYSINSSSAIRSIRLVMRTINGDYKWEDLIEYTRTGFSPLTAEESVTLESYVKMWNIKGRKKWTSPWGMNPDGRRADKKHDAEERLRELNRIREKLITPISDLHDSFKEENTVKQSAIFLCEFLLKAEMPKRLKEEVTAAKVRGDRMEAQYHSATWKCIVSCLETMEKVIGDMEISAEIFAALFEAMISKNDIGQIPTTTDEVLTGDIGMLRISNCRRLYIVGLNDGEFPSVSEGTIFTDAECMTLDGLGYDIADDSEQQFYDTLFSFYTLSSSTLERATYTYSTSGKKKPSSVIHSLKALFADSRGDDLEKNSSRYSLSALEYMENAKGAYEDKGYLCDTNREEIYGDTIKISQSRLDKFVHCPFSYAYTYVLKLREEKESLVTPDVFGTIIHLIFEIFLKLAEEKDGGIRDITDEEAESIIERVAEEFYNESGCTEEDDVRIRHLFRRIKAVSWNLIRDLRGEFTETSYRPVGFEVKVGAQGDVESPDITLEDGTRVLVEGIIDRLDSYKDEQGNVYIKIVDYKTGDRDLSDREIQKGYKLQMPLYMSAVCSSKSEKLKKITGRAENGKYIPAGMIYHIAKGPKKTEDPDTAIAARKGYVVKDFENERALGTYKGLKTNKTMEEIEKTLEDTLFKVKEIVGRMKMGECMIPQCADDETCAYCRMYPVCRIEKDQAEKN